MFVCVLLQLALCLVKLLRRSDNKVIFDVLLFAALLCMTAVLCVPSGIRFPWAAVPAFGAVTAVYSAVGIVREHNRVKNSITPVSVKEALDNLATGIAFADAQGGIVLINYAMAERVLALRKTYPRTRDELLSAFEGYAMGGEDDLYRLPDGSVWRLTEAKRDALTQITAENVTELYEANALLSKENEQLRAANEQMQALLERLADRIREEETLSLKTQIHNDIGTSLIALSRLIEDGSQKDVNYQLGVLQNAVGYFSNKRVIPSQGGVPAAVEKAREMGVLLQIDGDYADCASLVAAACDVCVTNCVNHAHGTEVSVNITAENGTKTIRITNNGTPPAHPITEGGGLSSLRRMVEAEQGVMTVAHSPVFLLTIITGGSDD
jgi:hypothetical protein